MRDRDLSQRRSQEIGGVRRRDRLVHRPHRDLGIQLLKDAERRSRKGDIAHHGATAGFRGDQAEICRQLARTARDRGRTTREFARLGLDAAAMEARHKELSRITACHDDTVATDQIRHVGEHAPTQARVGICISAVRRLHLDRGGALGLRHDFDGATLLHEAPYGVLSRIGPGIKVMPQVVHISMRECCRSCCVEGRVDTALTNAQLLTLDLTAHLGPTRSPDCFRLSPGNVNAVSAEPSRLR